ncbi:MAG: DUF3795 domain-containing protein [Anaerolineaceae bacterium]|nr:DUF3795 domain-containing protein [Anaerolineaceae bacterium]
MPTKETKYPELLDENLIAPCGMNCGLCIGYLREKKPCAGCHGDDENKPKHCVVCRIKTCLEMESSTEKFCYTCKKFPCARMHQLDKRYRTNYGMSMIENLERIRDVGLEAFVVLEKERWKCPECGAILSVHRKMCIYCGQARG